MVVHDVSGGTAWWARVQARAAAEAEYREAVLAGLWPSIWQRPAAYIAGEGGRQPWYDPYSFGWAVELEAAAAAIAAEAAALLAASASHDWQQEVGQRHPADRLIYQDDHRRCRHCSGGGGGGGGWSEIVLSEGAGAGRRCPTTLAALRRAVPSVLDPLEPHAQAVFSVLQPGTHIRPHCGPSNRVLTGHLCLEIGAADEATSAVTIRVGPPLPEPSGQVSNASAEGNGATLRPNEEDAGAADGGGAAGAAAAVHCHPPVQAWRKGKLLVFDDSFEHEVHHRGSVRRVVLLFNFRHPNAVPAGRKPVGFREDS